MRLGFISSARIDALLDGPWDTFPDEGPEAVAWEELNDAVRAYLSRFAPEEDAPDADGTPGFLLQDIFDGTKTMGIEFNAPDLLCREKLGKLSTLIGNSGIQIYISTILKGSMHCIIVRNDLICVPKVKSLIRLLGE